MLIKEKIEGLSNIISDYKFFPSSLTDASGQLNLDLLCDHINKWLNQFDSADREFVLSHTFNIMKKNYYSEKAYNDQIHIIANNKRNYSKLRRDCLLSIQAHGNSQSDINSKLNEKIKSNEDLGFTMPICNLVDSNLSMDINNFSYLHYFDDFSFSGNRVFYDIKALLETREINNKQINLVLFLAHTYGLYALKTRLEKLKNNLKLNINFHINNNFWGLVCNDISDMYSHNSTVYFPKNEAIVIPEKFNQNELYHPNYFRNGNHKDCLLGNDSDRNRIEKILTYIGFGIMNNVNSLNSVIKPLGFSTFNGFGFGGNVFSYRNCPNNTPLAFWWGNYEKEDNNALDCWYPLMQRATYYS